MNSDFAFLLKKVLSAFILPPGIFILLSLFFCAFFLFRRQTGAALTNLFLAILMWLLSISPVSDALLRGLESGYAMPDNPHGDVIVLLGGGIYENVEDLTGKGIPSGEMMGRLVTAVRLQKRLGVPIIVSGGKVFDNMAPEAEVDKRFLVDLGVPPGKIILEDKSRDTIENAINTKKICDRMGFRKPILVTSAVHMKRSLFSFRKAGLTVVPLPANFRTWNRRKYYWHDYLPEDFSAAQAAAHECLGLLYYRLAY
jgi:uncharacterized SAM-binding protein YcdF (DUF218 family)